MMDFAAEVINELTEDVSNVQAKEPCPTMMVNYQAEIFDRSPIISLPFKV